MLKEESFNIESTLVSLNNKCESRDLYSQIEKITKEDSKNNILWRNSLNSNDQMEDSFLLKLHERYVSGSICQNEDELRKVFEEKYIDKTIDQGDANSKLNQEGISIKGIKILTQIMDWNLPQRKSLERLSRDLKHGLICKLFIFNYILVIRFLIKRKKSTIFWMLHIAKIKVIFK